MILSAIALYMGIFVGFVIFEVPGLGIGHFYYVAVAMVALAGGTWAGIGGGLLAAGLYVLSIALTPRVPTHDAMTMGTIIRTVTYCSCGALIGWFADQHRDHVRQLRELAERDFLTGLLNTRAFDESLARRCASDEPFVLVLGDIDDLKTVNDTHGHAEGNRVRGRHERLGRGGAGLVDAAQEAACPRRLRAQLRLGGPARRRPGAARALPQGGRPAVRGEAAGPQPPRRAGAGGCDSSAVAELPAA
ncbi:MAG: GGDEF domain-containing protein [Actinobacteria bacterium]|nr:MAG: GGDEF domain-containing protein [Actinomycetota bacterium]